MRKSNLPVSGEETVIPFTFLSCSATWLRMFGWIDAMMVVGFIVEVIIVFQFVILMTLYMLIGIPSYTYNGLEGRHNAGNERSTRRRRPGERCGHYDNLAKLCGLRGSEAQDSQLSRCRFEDLVGGGGVERKEGQHRDHSGG